MTCDATYRSFGSIMTRDDKGDKTDQAPFNSVHPNSSVRMTLERRVKIIFLSPSRTADENNVRVGQEMVLPLPLCVRYRNVLFHSTRSSDSDKHTRERERRKKATDYMGSSRTKKAPVRCEEKREMREHLVLESI